MIGDRWPVFLALLGASALFTADAVFNWAIFGRKSPSFPHRTLPYSPVGRVFRAALGGFVFLGMLMGGARDLMRSPGETPPRVHHVQPAPVQLPKAAPPAPPAPPAQPAPPPTADDATRWAYEDDDGVTHVTDKLEWVPEKHRATARRQ